VPFATPPQLYFYLFLSLSLTRMTRQCGGLDKRFSHIAMRSEVYGSYDLVRVQEVKLGQECELTNSRLCARDKYKGIH
jgi:hypothetical protein